MVLTQKEILFYRSGLFISVAVILFFATAPLDNTVIVHVWDKLQHLVAFLVLAVLLDYSFPLSQFNLRKFMLLVSFGLLIELIQHPLQHRYFSLLDVFADGVGALLYIPLQMGLKKLPFLKRRFAHRRYPPETKAE